MTLLLKMHVEGGVHQASFASRILRQHFDECDCGVAVVINKTSTIRGIPHRVGVSHYAQFRVNTSRLMKNKNAVVITMIDYYGFTEDFPGMKDVGKYPSAPEQVRYLERMMDEDITG